MRREILAWTIWPYTAAYSSPGGLSPVAGSYAPASPKRSYLVEQAPADQLQLVLLPPP